MYIPEPRVNVDFDDFNESTKLSGKFKKNSPHVWGCGLGRLFFASFLRGLLIELSDNRNFTGEPPVDILGLQKTSVSKRKLAAWWFFWNFF